MENMPGQEKKRIIVKLNMQKEHFSPDLMSWISVCSNTSSKFVLVAESRYWRERRGKEKKRKRKEKKRRGKGKERRGREKKRK